MKKQNLQQGNMNNLADTLILPHNDEAERATVAAMLLENALYEVIDFLKPEMFYDEFLSETYRAILSVEAHSEVDLITVSRQ